MIHKLKSLNYEVIIEGKQLEAFQARDFYREIKPLLTLAGAIEGSVTYNGRRVLNFASISVDVADKVMNELRGLVKPSTEGRYDHGFSIAFSVKTDNTAEEVTSIELLNHLRNRLRYLSGKHLQGSDEIIEACGMPFDTIDNEEEEV